VIVLALLLYVAYFALDHMGFVNDWTAGRIGMKKEKSPTMVIDKNAPGSLVPTSQSQ
jgi:hypothetical protein